MGTFGSDLRHLRSSDGLRQQDLADRLGVARSTVGGIESGHDVPTPRFWKRLGEEFPGWQDALLPSYQGARTTKRSQAERRGRSGAPVGVGADSPAFVSAGPYKIVSVRYVYVFRASRVPEEIIEVRRVRAIKGGGDGYGVTLRQKDAREFEIESEVLWGGHLAEVSRHLEGGNTLILARVEFGKTLRFRQEHEFAIRHWVARDVDAGTTVDFNVTLPTEHAIVQLNFLGPARPESAWTFGPVASDALAPSEPSDPNATRVRVDTAIEYSVLQPSPGSVYGVTWVWGDGDSRL